MTDNKLEDASSDKKYFMITPQLVWAICRSPYDYTLWDVIKMIAGENGECYLSTEDLAILSMMSTGKVSQCRKYLIEKGLLKGEIRRDPGYPQPVWHLQIPDIWKENVTWRQEFDSLADRIALKKEQKKSLHRVKPSPDEEPPSPGEGGISPGEEPPSPGETKKNQVVDPQEEPKERETPSLRDQAQNGEMTVETEAALLTEWGRSGEAGIADPSQDIGQYVKFRDEALQIFDEKGGDFGRGQKQREARRGAIIEFISSQGKFDLERWRNALHTSIVTGSVQPGNLACFFDVYEAGGDYQEMCRQRKNGGKHAPNNRTGRVPSRVPEYSVADPAAFGEQPPDDA
jgi:hypothetical protein